MSAPKPLTRYAPLEEKINIGTHALGWLLSVVALVLLIRQGLSYDRDRYLPSVIIFGTSLIVLYAASTLYHSAKREKPRRRLKVFDHAAIYVLIAGTYTPFALVTMSEQTGWRLFTIVWGIAAAGIVLKLFFTGRFTWLSTLLYVAMGWLLVGDYVELRDSLHPLGWQWLWIGGACYTLGAVLYAIRSIPYNHAIFHVFVLGGSLAHFIAIYFFV